MRFKKLRGFVLFDVLCGLIISPIVMLISLTILSATLSRIEYFWSASDVWQRGSRLLLFVESRVKNAGLGVPSNVSVDLVFISNKGSPFEGSPLPGWKSVIEVLDDDGNPVEFVSDDAVGTRLRVLSTMTTMPDLRVVSTNFEWGASEEVTLPFKKFQNMPYSETAVIDNGFPLPLSSWMTMPSLGVPFTFRELKSYNNTEDGHLTAQNRHASVDWRGVDMLHQFRFAYFFVEDSVFYIQDSDVGEAYLPAKYPVENGISSVRFEFNRLNKVLKMILQVGKTQISGEWKIINY